MYKIIGGDGKQYGPVPVEQIRRWLTEGRVNHQTQVQAEGSAEWRALADVPELASMSGPAAGAPVTPPALPEVERRSGLAIASLVLGILGLFTCGLTALPGLILGIVALVQIGRSRGSLGGRGLAIAGTAVSGALIFLLPVLAGLTLPALARAKGKAQAIQCMNHMKQVELAVIMYANDSKERFPSQTNWCDAIQTYLGGATETLQCPLADPGQRSHYALNARIADFEMNKLTDPAQTVLIFETDGGWNLSGGPDQALQSPRHGGTIGVGFADGHVEMVTKGRLAGLRWTP